MASELTADQVRARLDRLRALYVPLGLEEARARMAAPSASHPDLSAAIVGRRLAELRALCELTAHLQRTR